MLAVSWPTPANSLRTTIMSEFNPKISPNYHPDHLKPDWRPQPSAPASPDARPGAAPVYRPGTPTK